MSGGYHSSRKTKDCSFKGVAGYVVLPKDCKGAGEWPHNSVPEIFVGIYKNGDGLDAGLLYSDKGWRLFMCGMPDTLLLPEGGNWLEGDPLPIRHGEEVKIEVEFTGNPGNPSRVQLSLYKNEVRLADLSSALAEEWGDDILTNGAPIAREFSLATNKSYPHYEMDGSFMTDAFYKRFDLLKIDGEWINWTEEITGVKVFSNEIDKVEYDPAQAFGPKPGRYHVVWSSDDEGNVMEKVSIDWRK